MTPKMFVFTAGTTDWHTAIKNRVRIPWPQDRKYGISGTPSLLCLPNEILENIASFLAPRNIHVMEGTDVLATRKAPAHRIGFGYGRSPHCQAMIKDRLNLRSLMLVCRRLRSIVERVMYRQISLPQAAPRNSSSNPYPASHMPYLVRTLLDRPDLALHTKSLDVWIRDRRLMKNTEEPDRSKAHPYYETFLRAGTLLTNAQPSFSELINWSTELYQYQEVALHAFLITLLPHLEDLKLYTPLSNGPVFAWHDRNSLDRNLAANADYSYLDVALRNKTLTSLYIGIPFPIKQYPATTLTSLEIDILFFLNRHDLLHTRTILPTVHSLTITINIPILNTHKLHLLTTTLHPRIALRIFLQTIVPNIHTFTLASPRGTLPFWQNERHIDRYDTPYPASIRLAHDPQDIENHPMHDPRIDSSAWTWLFDVLFPVRRQLKKLEIPREYYSSNGKCVQPMPSLYAFCRLETLVVPRVAVIPNRYGEGYDVDRHERRAVDFLPRGIKRLVVSQVDTEVCAWVQEAFVDKDVLPELEEVVLEFRRGYVAVLSFGFEDAAREAGVRVLARWMGQEMVL